MRSTFYYRMRLIDNEESVNYWEVSASLRKDVVYRKLGWQTPKTEESE